MANERFTLLEIMKRIDPNGAPAQIIQLLAEENNLLKTMPFKASNKETTHQISVRTGLPTVQFGAINRGVEATVDNTAQMEFGTGFVDALDQMDINLMDVSGNGSAYMSQSGLSKLEAMMQLMTATVLNGSLAQPHGFVGLSEYYSTLSTNPQNSGFNIIDGDGTGVDNESIWLVCWGDQRLYGIYPKNIGTAGFQRTFDGQENATDSQGRTLRVLQTHYIWHAGLVVADWRSCVRIANLDISDLEDDAAGAAKLVNLLIRATERIRGVGPKSAQFYMSERMMTFLRIQIREDTNVRLRFETVAGNQVLMFDNIPVNKVDQITLEPTVTA